MPHPTGRPVDQRLTGLVPNARLENYKTGSVQAILQPIDFIVYIWLAIAVLSSVYVAYDQFRHNPEAPVMKCGFVLVTLYMGPIGLLLYVMSDKEPAPGTHEQFIQPLWKQGVGSTVHCVAGDATGIIPSAAATALLGFPMWIDVIVEYVAGFVLGLLVFQSLFMRSMMGGRGDLFISLTGVYWLAQVGFSGLPRRASKSWNRGSSPLFSLRAEKTVIGDTSLFYFKQSGSSSRGEEDWRAKAQISTRGFLVAERSCPACRKLASWI